MYWFRGQGRDSEKVLGTRYHAKREINRVERPMTREKPDPYAHFAPLKSVNLNSYSRRKKTSG